MLTASAAPSSSDGPALGGEAGGRSGEGGGDGDGDGVDGGGGCGAPQRAEAEVEHAGGSGGSAHSKTFVPSRPHDVSGSAPICRAAAR